MSVVPFKPRVPQSVPARPKKMTEAEYRIYLKRKAAIFAKAGNKVMSFEQMFGISEDRAIAQSINKLEDE